MTRNGAGGRLANLCAIQAQTQTSRHFALANAAIDTGFARLHTIQARLDTLV